MSNDIPYHDERMAAIRDRDRNRCQNCFRTNGEVSQLEVHQIVPENRGGTERLSNYTLLCRRCHRLIDGAETQEAR